MLFRVRVSSRCSAFSRCFAGSVVRAAVSRRSTSSEKMRTLALGMALLQDDRYGTDFPMLMAAAALAIAPVVAVYAFLQRYFIRSVAGTGLKE